jgi:putative beta-1,4-xylosyltransferase IRX10
LVVFASFLSCNLIEDLFQCDGGYFGIDCSIPSANSVASDWPLWLQPPRNLTDLKTTSNTPIDVNVVVQKKRPLIYVYDLPAEFDNHLLEVSLLS